MEEGEVSEESVCEEVMVETACVFGEGRERDHTPAAGLVQALFPCLSRVGFKVLDVLTLCLSIDTLEFTRSSLTGLCTVCANKCV